MQAQSTRRVIIRSVALPSEHGGWGFLIEPIILGLLVAGSGAGLLLAAGAFGIFLIHQPLKVAVKDRRKGRRPPRAIWAERFAMGYGLLALIPTLILIASVPPTFLLPVLLAVPFAAVQLYYDARNQSRHLIPEICGALALAMIAPAIAVLGGWDVLAALPLWVILALRAITAILYVRSRLRLERGATVAPQPVWIIHAAALILVAGLALTAITPWLAVLPFGVLLARALIGLSRYRQPRKVSIIGAQEMVYGLVTAIVVAAGYRLEL
ncbi:MAG: YwiC-like family protein [Chloroflexi bacterium]|nr:YwiC-like family protein [Chloroflexota bacterium]